MPELDIITPFKVYIKRNLMMMMDGEG